MLGQASLRVRRFGLPLFPLVASVAAALIVAAGLFIALDSGDGDRAPSLADPSQTGSALVESYMSMLAAKDIKGLEALLSDAFLRQGAEGSFYTKAEYLQRLPAIRDYRISDVTALQAGDSLVVRWLFTVTEVIDGRSLTTEPTPRLATFVWSDGEWRLLSHANFNPPAASN